MKYRDCDRLDDDVGLRLLRLDVRSEVRLARIDRGLHLLHRRAALGDVALRLPRELDRIGDVKVDRQVERLWDQRSSVAGRHSGACLE